MKQFKLFILILFKGIVNFVKARFSEGNDLLQMDQHVNSFEDISFIASGVPLTSTAIEPLNLMIVLSLFYADLNDTCESSFKLTPILG